MRQLKEQKISFYNKIIFALFVAANYAMFLRLLSVTGGIHASDFSLGGLLFGILTVLFIFYLINNFTVLRDRLTSRVLVLFFYFIINNSFKGWDVNYIFANSLWFVSVMAGYVIGVKNNYQHVIGKISDYISIPFMALIMMSIPNILSKTLNFTVVSDCFFVCSIFLPIAYLSKIKKYRMCFWLFWVLSIISQKRSLIIIAILAIILILHFRPQKMKLSAYIVTMVVLVALVIVSVSGDVFNDVFGRFLTEDAASGSGRDVLYETVWNQIKSFSFLELMFGSKIMISSVLGINVHNDILQIIHSYGIVGVALYISVFYVYVRRLLRIRHEITGGFWKQIYMSAWLLFIIAFVIGNLNCLVINPPLMIPMMFFLGLWYGWLYKFGNV